jgi:hypothetical protein
MADHALKAYSVRSISRVAWWSRRGGGLAIPLCSASVFHAGNRAEPLPLVVASLGQFSESSVRIVGGSPVGTALAGNRGG